MTATEIDFNLDNYEPVGMVFQKILLRSDMDTDQANDCFKVCLYFNGLKNKSDNRYDSWEGFTRKFFAKKGYPKEDIDKFVTCYFDEARLPSGKACGIWIADNYSDITLFRTMYSEFYHNIAKPLVLDKLPKRATA